MKKLLMILLVIGMTTTTANANVTEKLFAVTEGIQVGLWGATGDFDIRLQEMVLKKADELCKETGHAERVSEFIFSQSYNRGRFLAISSAHFVCRN